VEATFEETISTLDYSPEFTIQISLNDEVKYLETQRLESRSGPQFTIKDGEITADR